MAIGLLAGCTPATLRVPANLESTEPLPVNGHSPRWRNEVLSFGSYRTARVNDGTRFDWAIPVRRGAISGASRHYRFVLDSGVRLGPVNCREAELGLRKRGYEIDVSGLLKPRLECEIEVSRPLSLVLNARGDRFEGDVADAGGRIIYDVRSLHHLAGSTLPSGSPIGFEVISRGQPVMAVETMNSGRVWLASIADQDELAAIAAAILLFRPDGAQTGSD